MRRLLRGGVALLATAILVGPLAFATEAQVSACPNVGNYGQWTRISAPPFTTEPRVLTAYAVDPYAPLRLYATNGNQLWATDDGGCSWEESWSIDLLPRADAPASSANSKITAIEVPERRSSTDIFLLVEEEIGPATRPHVVRLSGQAIADWKLVDVGLPAATTGVDSLTIAPSNSDTLYLHTRSPEGGEIYATNDGGANWELRADGTNTVGLQVDPFNQEEVWAYGAGLLHSTNGGRDLVEMDMVAPPVGMVDVARAPGKPSQVMAYEIETQTYSISQDGGQTWRRIMGPGGFALSMAHGPTPGHVMVSQHDFVSVFFAPEFWFPVTPAYDQLDLTDLQGTRTMPAAIYGMTPNNIERFAGFDTAVDISGFDLDGKVIDVGGSALRPAKKLLKIRVGKSRDVAYQMDIPEHPVPLDVFFLVDTSSSMDPTIRGLRNGIQDIINELAEARIDAQFGVGQYKDYPITGFGDNRTDDFAYRLNRGIGPADESLEQALEALRSSGGGDPPESQLTALYQAATGAGEPGCVEDGPDDVPGESGGISACVQPGQDAHFRKEALKVIVHMTDAEFHDGVQHPSPPFDQVASTLHDKGIQHVALSVYGMDGDEGRADLMRMTEEVGTVAPPGGVDCDGNGTTDIAEGEPLLCDVADWDGSGYINLTPSILATLKAVTRNVEVEMVAESGDRVVEALAPGGERLVDITDASEMATTVTYTCPKSLAKKSTDITLALFIAGVRAAEATATVRCLPIPDKVLAKKQIPPALLVPPAIAPLAVVIPVTPPPPPPVPQTINAPQSVQALQGVVAPQEQEQVQTALAYAQFKNDEAFALSARVQRPPLLPLYATALAMAAAFGFLMRPRGAFARSRAR